MRLGAAASEQAAAFSPDGQRIAVGTAAGNRVNLDVVDVGSRTRNRIGSWPSIPAAAGPLRFIRLAFSRDGSRIAVAVATATPSSPVPVGQRLLLVEAASGRVVWERNYPLRPGQNEAQVEFTRAGRSLRRASRGTRCCGTRAPAGSSAGFGSAAHLQSPGRPLRGCGREQP